MIRKELWAVRSRHGFVQSERSVSGLRTLLFSRRRDADAWLAANPYWTSLKAQVVKVIVKIEEW